ncbi:hypothetical protein [Daejeonella lutea]|uniref:EF hand n=1 Tax=Daejeonella lutea TaxID=572036 RepID=A0A1T4ZX01_9SPHI|nr:hypothetical protein [Daejeonella lutea]SKB27019.1 hypothetical protein SAMN05661099_0005 [Daejeonella lutea]
MKKLVLSAAIALLAVTAFAQTNTNRTRQRETKEQVLDRLGKDHTKKNKGDIDHIDKSVYDVNQDGVFSPEEKEARKAAKMARKETRKANRELDRNDDGLLNGSTDRDNHGRDVSGTARGTDRQGREKGEAVSDVARTNGRSGDRMTRGGQTATPGKATRPAGSRKPTAVGRKMK